MRNCELVRSTAERFPDHTVVRFNYQPTLHAQLFLNAPDRSSDRLPERSSDRSPDSSSDRSPKRSPGRSPGRSPERFPENVAKAVQALAVAAPYELGIPGNTTFWTNLYPVYIRGQAFLAAHQGPQAAAEFQKILDWRGVVANEPMGAGPSRSRLLLCPRR
jgi:hypothetical protein